MSGFRNPALEAFIAAIGDELTFAQVILRKIADGFEIRHSRDREVLSDQLRLVSIEELRRLGEFTSAGIFRPLKSAPTLQKGWRAILRNPGELEAALNTIYPGAIADWYAVQTGSARALPFREYTGRQTGMYRITHKLTDEQAVLVVRAGCDASVCLKRRLWEVAGLAQDGADNKSLVPCLEPCALLLEFARKAMRLEQENKLVIDLPISDMTALSDVLSKALVETEGSMREADFDQPLNPRRLRLLLEKLKAKLNEVRPGSSADPTLTGGSANTTSQKQDSV
jgi:hypothetical protein